jgi:molybdenum cofactor cytidylyltransferase
MIVNGLVLAAGLSRRMGALKPLLRIGDKTLIEHSVTSLLEGGAQSVTVVLGRGADKVKKVLCRTPFADQLRFAYNENFATTDMLASIKIGVRALDVCDAFFLLPGDMPAVESSTLVAIRETMEREKAKVTFPTVCGRREHPPLISISCKNDILEYEGQDGLRGLWSTYEGNIAEVEVDDRGCVLDADTQEDFSKLVGYIEDRTACGDHFPPPSVQQ